jgi:hypothetical protein
MRLPDLGKGFVKHYGGGCGPVAAAVFKTVRAPLGAAQVGSTPMRLRHL